MGDSAAPESSRIAILEGSTFVVQTTKENRPSAYVDAPCTIGDGTTIWHFCHVLPGVRLGERCILGQNVPMANEVVIGNNVKIQNNVSVYTGVELEDDVFCGPACVVTHVLNPRSQVARHHRYARTLVRRGATIVCGVTIGR